MLAAAVARRCVVDLAGASLCPGDELLQRRRRHGRVHHDHARLAPDQRNRREIVDRLERQLRVERRADRVRLRGEKQRVPVRRGFRNDVGADRRARARPVLDDDRLPEPLRQLLRDHAHRPVDCPARRERHDHAHGARRVVLRGGGRPRAERRDRNQPGISVRTRPHGALLSQSACIVRGRIRAVKRRRREAVGIGRHRFACAAAAADCLSFLQWLRDGRVREAPVLRVAALRARRHRRAPFRRFDARGPTL